MGGNNSQTTQTNQSQNQTYSQLQNLIENLATQGTSNQTAQTAGTTAQQTAGTQTGATTGQTAGTTATQQNPWAPAVPSLTNLIGAVSNQGYGLTPAQQAALTSYNAAAGNVPGFGQPGANAVTNLFNSQNGTPQAGMWQDAFNTYQQTVSPYLQPNYTSATNAPQIQQMLNGPNGVNQNIESSIAGMFAGSGRDPTGNADASKAIATAETQADLPILLNNYNTLVGQQMGAASGVLGGAGSTAQGTTGLLQTPLMNQIAGLQQAGNIPGLWMGPSQTQLGAANTSYGLPYANIQTPWNMIASAAGLGGQTAGQTTGQQIGTTTGATTGQMTGTQAGTSAQQGQTANTTAGTSTGNTSGQSQGTMTGTSTTTQPINPISEGLGLGLGLLSLMPSDERLKENIEPVGLLHNGLNVYRYNFKGDTRPQIGLLAQEVEKSNPDAVVDLGVKFVDYEKATKAA